MNQYNPNIHHRKSIRLKGYDYSQAGMYFITICCQDRECLFGQIKNGEMIMNDAGTMVEKWYNELENKFPDIRCHEMIVMPNHFHFIIENIAPPVGADLRVCPNKSEPDNTEPDNTEPGNTVSGKTVDTVLQKTDNTGLQKTVNTGLEKTGNTVLQKTVNTGLEKTDNTVLQKTDNTVLQKTVDNGLENTDNTGLQKTDNTGLQKTVDNGSGKTVNTGLENIEGEHAGSPLHGVVQWFKTMTTNEYIRGVKTLGWQPFNRKLWQRNYYEHIIRNERSYQTISEYIVNNPAKWKGDKFYTL